MSAWDISTGTKNYLRNQVNEHVEVLSLIGDVALDGTEPKIHAHVVIGKCNGSATGGHLLEAHVRPTLEVVLAAAFEGDPERIGSLKQAHANGKSRGAVRFPRVV